MQRCIQCQNATPRNERHSHLKVSQGIFRRDFVAFGGKDFPKDNPPPGEQLRVGRSVEIETDGNTRMKYILKEETLGRIYGRFDLCRVARLSAESLDNHGETSFAAVVDHVYV